MNFDREFLTGSLGTAILALVGERPMYGYEILQESQRRSGNRLLMKEGTLYPALHQMERAGLLASEWRCGESGRARKYYRLTPRGRRQAQSKRRQWQAIAAAMRDILGEQHG